MEPKRSFGDDSPSASSEEDQEEDEEEEEEEDQEEEQKKQQLQPSGSETESKPSPDRAVKQNGKLVPSEPAERKKRSAEGIVSNGEAASKRVKTKSNSKAQKKQFFQRIWSEPEEMEVMKGLVEVSKNKPEYELNDIYECIKQKIPSSVTKRRLSGKIWNLKKKFKSCDKKVKQGAELSPQEENFLVLAVKAWGSVENLVKGRIAAKKPVKGKTAAARGLEGHEGTSVSALSRRLLKGIEDVGGGWSLNEEFVRKKTYLVDERKRVELDQRWKRLEEKELQLIVERARLINDHAAVICQTVTH
ncbi:probable transcription factor At1g11510 [Punica granatum]|uniref:Glabrous enhancer-binding protein-like DBD domain-containing protein n=2 Tax=Punica granatum TaxID=22663 RepID=A0A218WVN8_PUNGR|nr:probable transcription factor At1g11510 [Punica granatum]OWM76420.1 hypothetical protein CDL15_Pgr023963 [Punica granatum]PKH65443.1 hypothetical protein CRG98_050169 [Punica granatum]